MEGVGARLGRTSTRYGPATVFTGPVRKWKKKWVHVAPSTKDNNSHNNSNHSHQIHNHGGATAAATANGTSTNGNNGSHLLLYKWTPITQSQNTNNNNNNNNNSNNVNGGDKHDVAAAPEEPPRRKIRYIPIAVLEEQKNEDAENEAAENVDDDDDDDDDKQIDIDPNATESTAKVEVLDEKPDINDVPMEENQDNNQLVRQDLNERTLDLSLGLKAHDDDHDPDSKTD
ncbi:uncharacterized protein LOC112007423 [Quercus suber]|uniref:Uncharacterized protein n=1 Tax=Quercus suber TaxID=58331 RepID=A0AAW0KN97_QUESU|nr:putative uncharacterized protein DDB_G0286105 [Quercus suber]POE57198.1 hypothetical protein CFP56_01854 [Quercus suber]